MIGNGSNLLFSDHGFDGIILSTRSLDRVEVLRDPTTGRVGVFAEAGAPLDRVIRVCEEHGAKALGFLAGIPGTVGGAVTMNAGSKDRSIGEQVLQVEAIEPSGRAVSRSPESCAFRYRGSALLDERAVVTGAFLSAEGEPFDRQAVLAMRHRSQPMDEASAGCVFRNPDGASAGRLIDECGLKGFAIGGARVSEKHANFIVNYEEATSAEIRMVIDILRQKVYNGSHILLDLEIEVIDG